MRKLRKYIFCLSIVPITLFGWACADSSHVNTNIIGAYDFGKVVVLNTEALSLAGLDLESQTLIYSDTNTKSYWQYVKAPSAKASRGTIIYSVPYTGVDWTNDPIDTRWASDPSAATGYIGEDVDGPLYDTATSKAIFYQKISKEEMPMAGISFSFNGYDVLYIYHRFYAGRYAHHYISDTIAAIKWLQAKQNPLPIGLFGMSLGGFISSHAGKNFAASEISAMVLVSPLLSWPQQQSFLNSLSTQIPSPSKRAKYLDFFEPYIRRFSGDQSKLMTVPTTRIPTLVLHDEWDTLVPISQSEEFTNKNTNNTLFLKFPHTTEIDFMSMDREHSQPGSGMNIDNILPIYLSYLINRVGPQSQDQYIFYTKNSFDQLLTEMHGLKLAGKDIMGFQKSLSEMCRPNFIMWELNRAAVAESGPQYLVRKINEVWGHSEAQATICNFLRDSVL